MKKLFFSLATLLFFFLLLVTLKSVRAVSPAASASPTLSPQREQLALYHPRLLPTSPFYFLKHWKEKVEWWLARTPAKRAEKRFEFATRRLAEAKAVAKKHPQLAEKLVSRYQEQMEKFRQSLDKIPVERRAQLLSRVSQASRRHLWVLHHLEDELPLPAKKHLEKAIQRSLEGHRRAIEAIEKHWQQLPPPLQKRVKKHQEILQKQLEILEKMASRSDNLKVKDWLKFRHQQRRRRRKMLVRPSLRPLFRQHLRQPPRRRVISPLISRPVISPREGQEHFSSH